MAEDGDVAILVANVHLFFDNHGRAPRRGEHVVHPVDFARFGVEAMEQAAEVGDVQHVVFNRHGAAAAVHLLFEIDLTIAITIALGVVPQGGRVGIGASKVPLFGDH